MERFWESQLSARKVRLALKRLGADTRRFKQHYLASLYRAEPRPSDVQVFAYRDWLKHRDIERFAQEIGHVPLEHARQVLIRCRYYLGEGDDID